MKFKIIIIFLLTSFLPLAADLNYLLKNYGIKGGLSVANQQFSVQPQSQLYYIIEGGRFQPRPGFAFGIFAEWFDEPYINLVTELSFVQKGTVFNTGGVTAHEYNNRLDYLSLPILAKLKYPDFDYLPYLLFGVRYDFLLDRAIQSEVLLYDKSKTGNLGTTLGCGYEFTAGGFPLLIEYTYHNQYANLLEDENYLYTARNVSHSLVLGYRFKDTAHKKTSSTVSLSRETPLFSLSDTLLTKDDFISFMQEKDQIATPENSLPGYTKSSLVFSSLVLPGSAQFATGRYYAGSAYALLFAGALYLCYDRVENYNRKIDRWQQELNKIGPTTLFYDFEIIQARCNKMRKEINEYETTIYYSAAGAGLIYLVTALDAVIFTPKDQLRVNLAPDLKGRNSKIKLEIELGL